MAQSKAAVTHTVGGGTVEICEVAPGILYVIYTGNLEGGLADFALKLFNDMIARASRLALFVDADGVSGYTSEFRAKITRWAADKKGRGLDSIDMLFRSKLVAMGVSVVNMVTGGVITSHSDRRRFDDAMRARSARAA